MTLLPVIERELRAVARHAFTHNLRVLGVLALLVAFGVFGLEGRLGPGAGGDLFGYLHCTLFCAIWLLVPLLSADCLSRERREGTLPLLFLTPLKPRDIVCAKGLTHGLRAFTLWLAALPVLTVCFVAGGVSWPEVVISVLVNFSALCLALAAGLVASAKSKVWTRALAASVCLAFALLMALLVGLRFTVISTVSGTVSPIYFGMSGSPDPSGFVLATDWDGIWQLWLSTSGNKASLLVWAYANAALLSFLCFVLLVSFAGRSVSRGWQEQAPSARVLWLKDKLLRPVFFQSLLRRWLAWELRHNPIGWLERRSWSGRLVVWSWFAVVTCVYSSLFANFSIYQGGFHRLQKLIALLLTGAIALSASGSFRRERESGLLELLLVAPLREWQIISGRVRGLWGQFLPAAVLLCGVWLYGTTFLPNQTPLVELESVLLYAITFVTLPIVGLYFSLTTANFLAALFWTLAIEIILPAVMGQVVEFFSGSSANPYSPDQPSLLALLTHACWQVLVALLLAWRLHANLRYRRFAAAKSTP